MPCFWRPGFKLATKGMHATYLRRGPLCTRKPDASFQPALRLFPYFPYPSSCSPAILRKAYNRTRKRDKKEVHQGYGHGTTEADSSDHWYEITILFSCSKTCLLLPCTRRRFQWRDWLLDREPACQVSGEIPHHRQWPLPQEGGRGGLFSLQICRYGRYIFGSRTRHYQ